MTHLFQKLFAFVFRRPSTTSVSGILALHRTASDYEKSMPNLAAELRYIASRG